MPQHQLHVKDRDFIKSHAGAGEMRDLFRQQASAYALYRPKYPGYIIDWVLRHVPKGRHRIAVDLGTGSGQVAGPLAASKRFSKVIGIDRSEAQLEQATKLFPEVEFRVGDAANVDPSIVPTGAASLVTSAQMAHWLLEKGEWERYISGLERVLDPVDGLACILGYEMCTVDNPDLKPVFDAFYKSTMPLWHEKCNRSVLDKSFEGVDFSPLRVVAKARVDEPTTMTTDAFLEYVKTWSAFTNVEDYSLHDKLRKDFLEAGYQGEKDVTIHQGFFAVLLGPPKK
uniref:Methyltransferase domain-containing protein n=1 Tax=Mucochytrium quahogii TaxID=96639 RepID=A0A7S2S4I1_9STRA|mmetsp:Transcript_18778/g.30680  ORF Transcript_18778/g.30680 Transcript_18778/m.30680 type:complete len:284 (-) Transcript_18778:104-955(-)|eukprot:CAMPEP_0203750880 /NCGR_PEP_ID=MMETSP0098-20131031/5039_1 /ASSEMBLY_ACC=CAM_ASM_000208 /TAXON_ID=96639 /ORGANISM=" , Strain NY0313808BC1" /LENGTH=283 /DNA_ID=CAMNT_0050640357 /DNA_START=173 /DNA_END=1024 /DNA_ORIENTATION=+